MGDKSHESMQKTIENFIPTRNWSLELPSKSKWIGKIVKKKKNM